MKIVLISGYARCGKDLTASILEHRLKLQQVSASSTSFASPMKRIVAKTMGILPSQLEGFKNDSSNMKLKTTNGEATIMTTNYRAVLQRFGTEGMKSEFGDNVWIDLAYKEILKSDKDVVIISDWRFKQELWRLQYLSEEVDSTEIITIRVVRRGQVNTATHSSEVDLDDGIDFDYTIDNDGVSTLHLSEQLDDIIKESIND